MGLREVVPRERATEGRTASASAAGGVSGGLRGAEGVVQGDAEVVRHGGRGAAERAGHRGRSSDRGSGGGHHGRGAGGGRGGKVDEQPADCGEARRRKAGGLGGGQDPVCTAGLSG